MNKKKKSRPSTITHEHIDALWQVSAASWIKREPALAGAISDTARDHRPGEPMAEFLELLVYDSYEAGKQSVRNAIREAIDHP